MTLRQRLNRYEPVSMHRLGHDIEEWAGADGAVVGEYVDLTSGLLVANVGHDRGEIARAAVEARGWTGWYSPVEARLRAYEALNRILPKRKYVMLNSGSEAIDCAIKVCNHNGYRPVALRDHYWGNTIGAWQLARQNDPTPLRNAWFLQAFRGPTCKWLTKDEMAFYVNRQRLGDILVFDENQAGFGRTGRLWGFDGYGVKPEIVVAGKAIAGGVPCSVVAGWPKLMDCDPTADYPSTFSGNAFACEALVTAVGLLFGEKLIAKAHEIGNVIQRAFDGMKGLNGRGAAWAIRTINPECRREIVELCRERFVLVMDTGEAIKLAPPLVITGTQLVSAVETVAKTIREVAR